ncbi:retrotransposon protein, putative, ty1-copia subclass, partial [Tanacetum coccineum]
KDYGVSDKLVEELQVEVELQREPRTRTKPLRFRDESNIASYAFVAAEEEDTHEPLTCNEAVACGDISKWKTAMKEEMDSLRKNKTWELVDHPAGQKLVSCKWLFKIRKGLKVFKSPGTRQGQCPVLTSTIQPEWQRFVTLVKQSQELKTVSYHKLYYILKQH